MYIQIVIDSPISTKLQMMRHQACTCLRCRFVRSLSLPQLPEMIFAANQLSIEHCDGCGIYFKALDALQQVDSQHDLVKVAAAKAWREAR